MDVEIIIFPETKMAVIEHHGSPDIEHDAVQKLIAWKLENRLLDQMIYRSYGLHYLDPSGTPADEHHVDFSLSVEADVAQNTYGIKTKTIPSLRCARARDIGSRFNNQAVVHLLKVRLPQSGETPGDFPIIVHYVNVGPSVTEAEMITDVYLPLKNNSPV